MATSQPLVLMTGASGYIGNHVLAHFLSHGYRVRVVARSEKSFDQLIGPHKSSRDRIEVVIRPDITAPNVFDEAVKDVQGIIHVASPFSFRVQDNERDLILPALNGTKNVLESARKYGTEVKRVVITASFASVADFTQGPRPGFVYDESHWNPMTYEETKHDTRGLAYPGSKKLAEEYAWNFVKTQPDVKFTLTTIHPVAVLGPPIPGSVDANHMGTSLGTLYDILKMTSSPESKIPPTALAFWVDVRDVADAHLKAFELKTENPGRFIISAGKYTHQGIFDFWKGGCDPAFSAESQAAGLGPLYTIDTTKSRNVLGLKYTSFHDSLSDTAKVLTELSKQTTTSAL